MSKMQQLIDEHDARQDKCVFDVESFLYFAEQSGRELAMMYPSPAPRLVDDGFDTTMKVLKGRTKGELGFDGNYHVLNDGSFFGDITKTHPVTAAELYSHAASNQLTVTENFSKLLSISDIDEEAVLFDYGQFRDLVPMHHDRIAMLEEFGDFGVYSVFGAKNSMFVLNETGKKALKFWQSRPRPADIGGTPYVAP